jgi:NitT/TauT family transport system substrate-binding protein
MKKVVSEISGTVFSLPWLIAKDHGFFEAEGIDMEFVGHVAFEEARVSIYRA